MIEKTEHIYYLGLGSNQGNRVEYLESAKYLLVKNKCKVLEESSFYETEPYGMEEGTNPFINQVIKVGSKMSVFDFWKLTKLVEKRLGRTSKGDLSDRVIDIDILFFDDEIVSTEKLIIPHIDIVRRRFVLEPLAEIAEDLIHPVSQKSIGTLLRELDDDLKVKKLT